jgi:hypothetical protein
MLIDSVFHADLEYNISFHPICVFMIEYEPQNDQKPYLNTMWLDLFHMTNTFSLWKIGCFVALENGY